MCGIVFVFSDNGITIDYRKYFEQGLYADALRGFHSTGVFGINKNTSEVKSFKKAFQATDFLDMKGARNILDNSFNYNCFVGHNRWATKGEVIHKNAHPFKHGNITGVHNGSLWSQYGLPDNTRFPVDSENIMYSLDKIGIDETIKKLDGSFALVFHNAEDNTLNMVRNDDRPLHFAYANEYKTIIGASEPGMIRWIAERNKIKIMDDEIFSVDVGSLYQFNLGDADKTTYTQRDVELYSYPKLNNWGNRSPSYGNGYGCQYDDDYLPFDRGVSDTVGKSQSDRNRGIVGKLKELNVKQGETIKFRLTRFIEYVGLQNKDRGYMYGYTTTSPFIDVKIHGVDRGEYQLTCSYTGKVDSLQGYQSISPVLVVDGMTTKMIKDKGDSSSNVLTLPLLEDKEEDKKAVLDNFEYLKGPGRHYFIKKSEWEELTKYGCCVCQGNLDEAEHREILWLNDDSNKPMCPECAITWEMDNYNVGE